MTQPLQADLRILQGHHSRESLPSSNFKSFTAHCSDLLTPNALPFPPNVGFQFLFYGNINIKKIMPYVFQSSGNSLLESEKLAPSPHAGM